VSILNNLNFAEPILSKVAGDTNPHRIGYFVKHVFRSSGRYSQSRLLELTDKKGDFWESYNKPNWHVRLNDYPELKEKMLNNPTMSMEEMESLFEDYSIEPFRSSN